MKHLCAFLCIVALVVAAVPSHAEQAKEQVEIKSNAMELRDETRTVVFTGDVVAKRAGMTLYADRLEVIYIENAATKKREVEHMLATGSVKVIKDTRVATGSTATYYQKDDKIVLEGNPAVVRDKDVNQVTGLKITFFVKENKSYVEGDRPRAVFEVGN